MRKYFLYSLIFLFIAGPVFVQGISFEIAPYPEPDIENVTISEIVDFVTITARITDISGIYTAVATVRDFEGIEVQTEILYDDGAHQDGDANDDIYGILISTIDYPSGIYTVDIFAVDNLAFRRDFENAGSFSKSIECDVSIPKDAYIGEIINIDVSGLSGVGGISQIRFSSDNSQDAIPTGIWTDWFDWDNSSGDWNATNKIMKWTFTEEGDYEVWVEIEDMASQVSSCYDTISVELNCLTGAEDTRICVVITTAIYSTQIDPFTSDILDVQVGDTINLSATLKYLDTGNPIVSEKINFIDTTDSVTMCTDSLTNDQGVATCSYQIPGDATLQIHTLKAEYLGNRLKQTEPGENSSLNITILNDTPIVDDIYITPAGVGLDDTMVCNFIISDPNSDDVLTADVTWEERADEGSVWTEWHNDDEVITPVPNGQPDSTSSQGNIEPSDTALSQQWRCKVTGRDDHEGISMARYSEPITIYQQCTDNICLNLDVSFIFVNISTQIDPFTSDKTDVVPGDTINLSATLKYLDTGNPIVSEKINFIDTTDSVTMCTDSLTNDQGVATCSYQIPPNASLQIHTLKAEYLGNRLKQTLPSESFTTFNLLNEDPVVEDVHVVPGISAATDDNLRCALTISDPNTLDTLTTDITWEKSTDGGISWTPWITDDVTGVSVTNGVEYVTPTSPSTPGNGTVSSANTAVYEQWKCKVTAHDGHDTAIEGESLPAIIYQQCTDGICLNLGVSIDSSDQPEW